MKSDESIRNLGKQNFSTAVSHGLGITEESDRYWIDHTEKRRTRYFLIKYFVKSPEFSLLSSIKYKNLFKTSHTEQVKII